MVQGFSPHVSLGRWLRADKIHVGNYVAEVEHDEPQVAEFMRTAARSMMEAHRWELHLDRCVASFGAPYGPWRCEVMDAVAVPGVGAGMLRRANRQQRRERARRRRRQ